MLKLHCHLPLKVLPFGSIEHHRAFSHSEKAHQQVMLLGVVAVRGGCAGGEENLSVRPAQPRGSSPQSSPGAPESRGLARLFIFTLCPFILFSPTFL